MTENSRHEMSGTSSHVNSINTLNTGFSVPPTLADLEALRQKLNEMIVAARR